MQRPEVLTRWLYAVPGQSSLSAWWRVAAAVLAGGAHAASLAWPWPTSFLSLLGLNQGQPAWWLQGLALGGLAVLLNTSRHWRLAALTGWVFATTWLVGAFGWTFVALHTYGGLPLLLAAPAVLALAGLLGLYYAASCGLLVALRPAQKACSAGLFAALWLMAELARGQWLTGFGWGAAGYAHVEGPLSDLAPWLGVYGIGAVAAWLAMTAAQTLTTRPARRPPWRVGAMAVLVLLVPGVYQQTAPSWSQATGTLSVTLLQGNIAQDEKFETGSGVPLALDWYARQLASSSTDLVIAPETAIPLLPEQLPPDYWASLQQRFANGTQAALVGIPLGSYEQGYTNSVMGLKPGQAEPWRYNKHHLVPFGEFIPPFFKWFTALMNIPLGDFNRGAARQAPFEWRGQLLSANICYEDLFSEELALQFAPGAPAPSIFVNVSNLAWFGNSLAMDHHLHMARLRAQEFARPFVLATNTGMTAIVDHRGQVRSITQRDTRAILVGQVEGRSGTTPYAWWVSRLGLWPLWGLALAMLVWAWRLRYSAT
jgi:apolipoprotein N-acyltransferase